MIPGYLVEAQGLEVLVQIIQFGAIDVSFKIGGLGLYKAELTQHLSRAFQDQQLCILDIRNEGWVVGW